MQKRPDIVFIVLDTQRLDRLSCYGYPLCTSPHIDVLASEATLFTRAISPAQWTLPAHASLFTGLYPSEHTVTQFDSVLPLTVPTLAERLQNAGYFTAAISNNPLIGKKNNGMVRGFEFIKNYGYWEFDMWNVNSDEDIPVKFSLRKEGHRLRRNLANWFADNNDEILSHWWVSASQLVMEKIIRRLGGTKYQNTKQSLMTALNLLIKRRDIPAGQPVFTFINLMGTHTPYDPPSWALKPSYIYHNCHSCSMRKINAFAVDTNNWLLDVGLPDQAKQSLDVLYDAEVLAQDDLLGYFFKRLRDSGRLANTWLILVSDHGEHLGEKGLMNHVFGAYQELVHVPLMIYVPTAPALQGQKIHDLVSTRRLFHTILTAATAANTDEMQLALVYHPVEEKPCISEVNTIFVESIPATVSIRRVQRYHPDLVSKYGYDQPIRAIYHGDYKLIAKQANTYELYALSRDPAEQDPCDEDPARAEQLLNLLNDFVQTSTPLSDSIVDSGIDDDFIKRLRGLGYWD